MVSEPSLVEQGQTMETQGEASMVEQEGHSPCSVLERIWRFQGSVLLLALHQSTTYNSQDKKRRDIGTIPNSTEIERINIDIQI